MIARGRNQGDYISTAETKHLESEPCDTLPPVRRSKASTSVKRISSRRHPSQKCPRKKRSRGYPRKEDARMEISRTVVLWRRQHSTTLRCWCTQVAQARCSGTICGTDTRRARKECSAHPSRGDLPVGQANATVALGQSLLP